MSSSRRLLVIGIGAGDPDQLTLEAVHALQQVDVVFVNDKGPAAAGLVRAREELCARHRGARDLRVVALVDPIRDPDRPYRAAVDAWHERRARAYETAFRDELDAQQVGAFLVWGDPSLYDSTLRILDRVEARGALHLDVTVVPGITSVQALAARHRVALNDVGGPLHLTTGRQLRAGAVPDSGPLVVLLDGECSFADLDDRTEIYWGANVGTPHEALVAGPVGDVTDTIREARRRVREQAGWVLDTYLLRRPDPGG